MNIDTYRVYQIDGNTTRFIDSYSTSYEAEVFNSAKILSEAFPGSMVEIRFEPANIFDPNKIVRQYKNGEIIYDCA